MKRSLFAVPVVALGLLASSNAHAIERQHHIGLSPSLSMLKVDGKPTLSVGLGGGLHYTYGLNDQFNFVAEGNFSVVAAEEKIEAPETPRNRPTSVGHVSAGIGYVIDILRWVPYANATTGVYQLAGGTLDSAVYAWGVALAIGLDYQLSRHWALGVKAQQHLVLTKLSDYPSYTNVLLRFEYMWGF